MSVDDHGSVVCCTQSLGSFVTPITVATTSTRNTQPVPHATGDIPLPLTPTNPASQSDLRAGDDTWGSHADQLESDGSFHLPLSPSATNIRIAVATATTLRVSPLRQSNAWELLWVKAPDTGSGQQSLQLDPGSNCIKHGSLHNKEAVLVTCNYGVVESENKRGTAEQYEHSEEKEEEEEIVEGNSSIESQAVLDEIVEYARNDDLGLDGGDISEYDEVTVHDDEEKEVSGCSCASHASSAVASFGKGYYYAQNQKRWVFADKQLHTIDVVPSFNGDELRGESNWNGTHFVFAQKQLFRGDDCSETKSTEHGSLELDDCERETVSVLSDDLETKATSNEYEEISVASHYSDSFYDTVEEASLILPSPRKETIKITSPENSSQTPFQSPYPSSYETECKETLQPTTPQLQVVRERLPEEAQRQQFAVVNLTFIANPLTKAKIERAFLDSWSILESGGTLYVCHVIQRYQENLSSTGIHDSNVDMPIVKSPGKNITDLGPYIPEHLQNYIRQVSGEDISLKQRDYEMQTLEILRQSGQHHTFNVQRDWIQRWQGTKPRN